MTLGVVKELWRYPVKSLGGEALDEVRLLREGMLGDRTWACVDAASGEIRSGKRHPELLALRARHLPGAAPRPGAFGADVAEVEVEAPGGARFRSRDSDAPAKLSAAAGHALRLAPLAPAEDRAHYRLRQPLDLASAMAPQPGEPMPDFSDVPADLLGALMELIAAEPRLTAALVLHCKRHVGVNVRVEREGAVRVGDAVELAG